MLNGEGMCYVCSVQASLAIADSGLDFRLLRLIFNLSAHETHPLFCLSCVAAGIDIVRAARHASAPARWAAGAVTGGSAKSS